MNRHTSPATAATWGGLVCLWLLVLLVPLVVLPTAVDAFAQPKLVVAETLGLLSLALLAPALVVGLVTQPLVGRRLAWGLLPLLAVATLGWRFTDHPEHVGRGLAHLWVGAACLAGWALALPAERLRRALDSLAPPAVILAGLAILQYHHLFRPFRFPPVGPGAEAQADRLEMTALAGSPADLAAFLVLPSLLAQLGIARGPGWKRVGWALVLALCLYALALAQTLTAGAALAAATMVLWGCQLPKRKALRLLPLALVGAIVTAALVAPVRTRAVESLERAAAGDLNHLLTGRLDGWRAAHWMVADRPWTGVGHGAFRAEFGQAKLALTDSGVAFYPYHGAPSFANAHNELLEVAAEWGVPGLLALGISITVLLGSLTRARRSSTTTDRSAVALAWAGTTACLFLSLGHFPFRLALTAFPFLLFLAWVLRSGTEEVP